MGASAAWHLARRGIRDVLVLDRGVAPGAGSTHRATGGFRAQYATAINVRLSLLSRKKLLSFREEIGIDPGYVQTGYLWLASTEREREILREGMGIQHAEGLVEAVEVSSDDVGRINPFVARDEVAGGAFCPTDGFIRPMKILDGYLSGAERLGARVVWGAEAIGVERGSGGLISTVMTSRGDFSADVFVNAAGPWAGELGKLAGVDVPVSPLRRQVAATVPCDALPADMPMTIFTTDGFHFRVRDGRVLLLWPTPGVPGKPFDTSVDPAWIEEVVAKTRRRVPALRNVPVDASASWAGLYEMSPDRHALLGPASGCPNLFLIDGSSGHGVMHAPALGQLLAEMIIDGAAKTLDVSPVRPSRFAEGQPNPVSELL
jgi:sarcosine oxidase subunit beta